MVSPVATLCQSTSADELIHRRILDGFLSSGRIPFRTVRVLVRDGHVRLSGRVGTWYLKQLAQVVVMDVDGVESLDNQIVVA